MRKTLDRLKTSKPAVPLKGKNLVFAQPTLIAEIEFRGWTHDGSLRHASYKGLREVQDNAAVSDMGDPLKGRVASRPRMTRYQSSSSTASLIAPTI